MMTLDYRDAQSETTNWHVFPNARSKEKWQNGVLSTNQVYLWGAVVVVLDFCLCDTLPALFFELTKQSARAFLNCLARGWNERSRSSQVLSSKVHENQNSMWDIGF